MQKQKNGHTGLLPNVTVIPFFPLEDVWIMVFELSLIRFAFLNGVFLFILLISLFYRFYPHFLQQHLSQ